MPGILNACDKVGHFHDFQRGFYRSDPMLHTSVSFRTIMPSARNITNASQSVPHPRGIKFALVRGDPEWITVIYHHNNLLWVFSMFVAVYHMED